MSAPQDNHDLFFLEDVLHSQDETDAVSTKVISFERDSEIPPKFLMRKIFSPHREPPCHFDPAEEKISRRKKVLSTWGKHVDEERPRSTKGNGILALLSFDQATDNSREFNSKVIHQLVSSISKLVGGDSVEALKYNDAHILVEFHNVSAYEKLGRQFMDGQTENIHGFKLVEIQAVSIVTPHPCYLELSCSADEGQQLLPKLSALLVSFCSKFSYLCLREPVHRGGNEASPTNSPQSKTRKLDRQSNNSVPAFGVMLMFTSRAQKNADKLLGGIRKSSEWKEFEMPKQIAEDDELNYELVNNTEVLLSVKQASPFAGIRITVFVNNNFEEMEKFYTLITGKSPLAYNKIEEGLSFRTYSLSSRNELQLVHHPSLQSHHLQNTALCFAVEDIGKLLSEIPGGVRNIGEDHWHVTDPDGNSVILYSSLN